MNAYERHGIQRLSPSNINAYITNQGFWMMRYLFGHREPTNAAMSRGNAVECGCDEGVRAGLDTDECIAIAVDDFNRRTALDVDAESRAAELENVPGMVEHGLELLRPLGEPVGYQKKIEIMLPEVPVPIIGYLDWDYEDGSVVDLKTTKRCPSDISPSHRRQAAVYHRAVEAPIKFLYATAKRSAIYEYDPAGNDLEVVRQAAIRMGRFLSISNDAKELAAIVTPDTSSFFFNGTANREKCREIFGV